MRILLVGDYPADPRLGSAKVYYKLREEFAALGHDCDVLLAAGHRRAAGELARAADDLALAGGRAPSAAPFASAARTTWWTWPARRGWCSPRAGGWASRASPSSSAARTGWST